jgi:hypothetical protein
VAIQHIHTYLVHPGKGASVRQINGATVPLDSSSMFNLLDGIYERSDEECEIDIIFKPTDDGVQQNDCRDLICAYLHDPTLPNGRAIAERLEAHTDRRPGLGLLFLISGKEGRDQKIVISRFPTDSAILVEENPKSLDVEFLERVFMKNKTSYKAVMYRDSSLKVGFWTGKAIDKQLNLTGESSDYWISEFLLSAFMVTPAQGTRRLAVTLRDAAKKSDMAVKQEIVAAATLAARLGRQMTSINEFADRFNLSAAAREAITTELKNPRLADERFQFAAAEFNNIFILVDMLEDYFAECGQTVEAWSLIEAGERAAERGITGYGIGAFQHTVTINRGDALAAAFDMAIIRAAQAKWWRERG